MVASWFMARVVSCVGIEKQSNYKVIFMKPLHYELTNFCQFEQAKFEYTPGVSVFWAENGFGKTNLWDVGQFFSWTGLLPGSVSKKDVLKWGEKTGGASSTFEHRGVTYTISWAIPGSACSMVWTDEDGPHTLVKAGEIQSKLENDIFYMPLRMLRDVCFVPQGSFADTIIDKGARIDYFSRITDTKRFTTIRDRVVKLRGQVPVYPDVDIEIDTLKTSISEGEERLFNLRNRLALAQEEYAKVIPDSEEAQRVLRMPVDNEVLQQMKDVEGKIAEVERSLVRKPSEPERPGVSEELCVKVLQLQDLAVDLQKIRESLTNLNKPASPDVSDSREDIEMAATLYPLVLKSVEKGECLVCGRKIVSSADVVGDKLKSCEARDTLNSLDKYTADLRDYEKEVSRLTFEESRKREVLTQEAESISRYEDVLLCEVKEKEPLISLSVTLRNGNIVEGFVWWEALKKEWERYHALHKQYLETSVLAGDQEICLSGLQNRLAILKKEGTVSLEQQKSARLVLEWVDARKRECTSLESETISEEAELKAVRKSLQTLEAQQRKRQETERLRTIIGEACDVLKPQRLPMRIMKPFLAPYNRRLSQYMDNAMVDYVCRMTPQFEYEFDKGDGWKPADRMSGGQLGNLALCAQLAKMDVIAHGCPLLVLDEPTYGLDEQRKRGMVKALRDLHAQEKGLYIMIVSHDPLLKEAADRVITSESFSKK